MAGISVIFFSIIQTAHFLGLLIDELDAVVCMNRICLLTRQPFFSKFISALPFLTTTVLLSGDGLDFCLILKFEYFMKYASSIKVATRPPFFDALYFATLALLPNIKFTKSS